MNPFKLILKPFGCLLWFLGGGVFLILVAMVALLWLAKSWAPSAMAGWMERTSGFPVRIDETDIGILDQTITFEDVVILNPPGFEDKDFLRIRRLAFKIPYANLIKGDLRATEVEIEIEKLDILLLSSGRSNLLTFIEEIDYEPMRLIDSSELPPALKRFSIQIGGVSLTDDGTGAQIHFREQLDYHREFINVERSKEVFDDIKSDLRRYDPPGIEPVFFEALFASIPLRCFPDIKPASPDIIPEEWQLLMDFDADETKKALEAGEK